MIENWITQERVLKGEPSLDNYLKTDIQLDWGEINSEAYDEFCNDVKNQKYEVRKLGKQLSLQTSVTKTAAFDGSISSKDKLERRRLVIDVTALTGTAVFNLEGTDDSTGATYYDVQQIQITKTGKQQFLFSDVYLYYRLQLLSIGTTVTYSSYLYETTFDFPLTALIRSKIFYTLYHRNSDDAFKEKAERYEGQYKALLTDTSYFYDEDDSGDISDEEKETTSQEVIFRVGTL